MAKAKPKRTRRPKAPLPVFPRNRDLEARLAANPDDDDTLSVFIDYLLEVGDPWADVLVMERRKHSHAVRKRRALMSSLAGGYPGSMFQWDRGFISKVTLKVDPAEDERDKQLRDILELRAAILLKKLFIPWHMELDHVAYVNQHAPITVNHIFTWTWETLAALRVPSLQWLGLYTWKSTKPDAKALRPLFDAKNHPKLKRLELYEAPLSAAVIEELLDGTLVRQLEWLFLPSQLGKEAVSVIRARHAELAHIPMIRVDGELEALFPEKVALWTQRWREEV